METLFSLLNGHPEPSLSFGSGFLDSDPWLSLGSTFLDSDPWLSFGSDFLDSDHSLSFASVLLATDPIFTILCGLGVFLFFLCYTVWDPYLKPWWNNKDIKKGAGQVQRRKTRGTSQAPCSFSGGSNYQSEVEEARKLRSLLKSFVPSYLCSPLGQHHDITCFRQLLCPDPSCEVCNTATIEMSQLLFGESIEDAAPCMSPVASTSTSIVSPSYLTTTYSEESAEDPLAGPLPELSVPLSTSLSLDMTTSAANILLPSPAGDSVPPEPVFPLESSFPTDHSLPQQHTFTPSTLHCMQRVDNILQPKPALSKSTSSLEPTLSQDMNPSPSLSHEKNLTDSLMFQSTIPPLSASPPRDSTLTATPSEFNRSDSETVLEKSSVASPSLLVPHLPTFTGGNDPSKLIPGLPLGPAQDKGRIPTILKKSGFIQENLDSSASEDLALDSCPSTLIFFNTILNISPVKTEDKESPLPSHALPLSLPEVQPQTLPPTIPQSQTLLQPNLQTQPQILPPPPSKTGCDATSHQFQQEALSLSENEVSQLEIHALQKQLHGWLSIPSVVQKSEETICPPAPRFPDRIPRHPDQRPVTIIPGDFPFRSEIKERLENHLTKRLVQQRWGLPHRILKSLSAMKPPAKIPKSIPEEWKTNGTYGLAWINKYNCCGQKDLNCNEMAFYERCLGTLQGDKDIKREVKDSPEDLPGDHLLKDAKIFSDEILGKERRKYPKGHRMCLSGNLGVKSGEKYCSKQERSLETQPKVDSSGDSVKMILPLPKAPYTQTEQRDSVQSVNGDQFLNAFNRLPVNDSTTRKRSKGSTSMEFKQEDKSPSIPIMGVSVIPTSSMGMRGQTALRNPPSNTIEKLVEGSPITKDGRESIKYPNTDKTNWSKTVLMNRHSPNLPQKPKDRSVNSWDTGQMLLGKGIEQEYVKQSLKVNGPEELMKMRELSAFSLQSNTKLDNSRNFQRKHVLAGEKEPNNISRSYHDPNSSHLKESLINGSEFKLKARQDSQAQGSSTGRWSAPESWTSPDSFWMDSHRNTQNVPVGYMTAPRLLHVHAEDRELNMQQPNEPRVSKLVSLQFQDNFPPVAHRSTPLRAEGEELAGGDGEWKTFKVTVANRIINSPIQVGQSPSETLFKEKMTHFLQQFHEKMNSKDQENFLGKSTFLQASLQSGGLDHNRTVCSKTTKGQKRTRDGKFLQHKLGHNQRLDTTCFPNPLQISKTVGKTQLKVNGKAWVEPVQEPLFNFSSGPLNKLNTKACRQEAVSAGQKVHTTLVD
ncbi:spermatogenesis-associated protein 31D1 [Tenrec ecaudatus]|uniref:spermatogenesis-associated protein 31D1 n=1 Tax=Tenrec ecaudatus TaxID=94439 RepID=UPI003F590B73